MAPQIANSQATPSNSLPSDYSHKHSSSRSIPIHDGARRRSNSETQLTQEEAAADYKDFLFYSRVVDGLSQKHREIQHSRLKYETQRSLENVMRTRQDLPEHNQSNILVSHEADYHYSYPYPSQQTQGGYHITSSHPQQWTVQDADAYWYQPSENYEETAMFDMDL